MNINYKINCPKCGSPVIHRNLDLTQGNSNQVNIDVEFNVEGLIFECEECGCETYVNVFLVFDDKEVEVE